MRGLWEQAIEAAGDGIAASKRASLTFHGLRHTAASLMAAAGMTAAPWLITAAVAGLPVAVLGRGAALAHLFHSADQ